MDVAIASVHDVGGGKAWQTLEPQARRLGLAMPVLPRLDHLVGLPKSTRQAPDGIFHRHEIGVGVVALQGKFDGLFPGRTSGRAYKHATLGLRLVLEPPVRRNREELASGKCQNSPPSQLQKRPNIALYVPLRVAPGAGKEIGGICLYPDGA